MRHHLMHVAMCAPMFVIAAILIVGGTGFLAAIIPALGCMLLMALMMWGMGAMGSHGRRDPDRRAASD